MPKTPSVETLDPTQAKVAELEAKIANLERRLTIDESTQCYTRQYFYTYFDLNAKEGDVVFFLDLDDFKGVNDHHGHRVGDALLALIAGAMIATVSTHGFVTRMSGDEFVVFLNNPSEALADQIDIQIRAAVTSVHVQIGELKVSRTASLGRVRIEADMQGHEAVFLADSALMRAKTQGKNRSSGIANRAIGLTAKRPSIEDVRLGLQRDEIGYYVQPILRCATREIAGYEALLRWERPSGEILGPAMFLDTMTAAYDANTQPPLAAARAASEWAALGQDRFIAFNISGAFLRRTAIEGLDWVREIIGDVPRDRIVFELVETIVNSPQDQIASVVSQFRERGIRVALDDFGVGHSTLERLQVLNVDFVKIDRRFLAGATKGWRERDLLNGMIQITHSLGAESVVEGVETAEEFELVQELGATYAQGFFLGRPHPIGAKPPAR